MEKILDKPNKAHICPVHNVEMKLMPGDHLTPRPFYKCPVDGCMPRIPEEPIKIRCWQG